MNDTFKTQSFGGQDSRPSTTKHSFIDLHKDEDKRKENKDAGFKTTDILSLKKMVIEEIKNEL